MTARRARRPLAVTGIGGVFFKASDPAALAAWYRDLLGLPVEPDGHATFHGPRGHAALATIWAPFPADTRYFEPSRAPFMVNYRVRDLDALLRRLRRAGAAVDERVEEHPYGRFGWAQDPEGNRFELWEPRGSLPAPARRRAAVRGRGTGRGRARSKAPRRSGRGRSPPPPGAPRRR